MRPVREITAEEEHFRAVQIDPDHPYIQMVKRDPVEPEPVGTIILMAFRLTGYDQDCDGSLMGRFDHINKDGEKTGWEPNHLGLYPNSELVVSFEELQAMFKPAGRANTDRV